MITGFNTDVEHDGVVYHVQTEDKGLDSPIILSLVYSGGAILASKRSPYQDLIASGFTDEALAERLKRQHRLICAAIHSGRINDLRKMGSRDVEVVAPEPVTSDTSAEPETIEIEAPEPMEQEVHSDFAAQWGDSEIVQGIDAEQQILRELAAQQELNRSDTEEQPVEEDEDLTVEQPRQAEEPWVPPMVESTEAEVPEPPAYTGYEGSKHAPDAFTAQGLEGLTLTLLDDDELYSGDSKILRVLVSERKRDDEKALGNIPVSIKILGTTFRPLIYTVKTERDGVASVQAEIPYFTSGRAAVLVKVVAKSHSAELRRIIHPSH